MRRTSTRRNFVFALAAACGFFAAGCLSPTLPLPPPENPLVSKVDDDGYVTLTGTEGSAQSGAMVYAFNRATNDGDFQVARSYLGDPAKFRLVHGGSEVYHSHHPHGGAIRWPRSPRAIDEMPLWHAAKNGPVKYPVIRTKSDRVDVEVIGPSETMDLGTECGSGLCQQLAGDFLFHCHVAHHYIAGMWGYWRVYNTIQQGANHNDVMPDLLELPDRKGRIKAGVTSDELIGKTVDWFGKQFKILEKGKTDWKADPAVVTLKDWVEMQFPPQGLPGHKKDERDQTKSYDATVLNWNWQGNRAMTKPENRVPNPRYQSTHPGERLPIVFEPLTGKVSWPHLKPHFGRRVPFSKGHNPSPWLEMIHLDEDGQPSSYPAKPGENGRWSLCPENAGCASWIASGPARSIGLTPISSDWHKEC